MIVSHLIQFSSARVFVFFPIVSIRWLLFSQRSSKRLDVNRDDCFDCLTSYSVIIQLVFKSLPFPLCLDPLFSQRSSKRLDVKQGRSFLRFCLSKNSLVSLLICLDSGCVQVSAFPLCLDIVCCLLSQPGRCFRLSIYPCSRRTHSSFISFTSKFSSVLKVSGLSPLSYC